MSGMNNLEQMDSDKKKELSSSKKRQGSEVTNEVVPPKSSRPSMFALPELSHEMMSEVMAAFESVPKNQVLAEWGYKITRALLCLAQGMPLNHTVVNFYLHWLCDFAIEKREAPSCISMSTSFYPTLLSKGPSGVEGEARAINFADFKIFLVPVRLKNNWGIAIIDSTKKSITYFDTNDGDNWACLVILKEYFQKEFLAHEMNIDMKDWELKSMGELAKEFDGEDHGIFALTFAEYYFANRKFDFTGYEKRLVSSRTIMIYHIRTGGAKGAVDYFKRDIFRSM